MPRIPSSFLNSTIPDTSTDNCPRLHVVDQEIKYLFSRVGNIMFVSYGIPEVLLKNSNFLCPFLHGQGNNIRDPLPRELRCTFTN